MEIKIIHKKDLLTKANVLTYSSRRKAHRDKKVKGKGVKATSVHEIVIQNGSTVLNKISSRCMAYVYDPHGWIIIK